MSEQHGTTHRDSSYDTLGQPPTEVPPATQFTATVPTVSSLVDALRAQSIARPNDIAYTFLEDGEDAEVNITFRELDWRAQSIAARLQTFVKAGDRAALVYEPGLEYIAALVGCFYAGVVAVPIYPPDPMRLSRTVTRLKAILDDAQADLILTSTDEYQRFGSLLERGRILLSDEIPFDEGLDWEQPEVTSDTLAFLQYTSGSTGTPKGVMLTHANLMFNFEHIKKFDEPNAVAVSWLPMYHDMGLIGLVLQVLQSGRRTVLMSPLSFVKRPFRWLRAISKYRAYATSGPSFAFDLCVQKISEEECQSLDLSCWTLACNGAEPVRPDTMERFAARFEPYGFRREAFYPCYGLAEATLIVSGGEKSAPPVIGSFDPQGLDRNRVEALEGPNGRQIVGCGTTVENQEIAIVDPATMRRCQTRQVGEIWVQGPGVAKGYWNNPEATAHTYEAFTSDGAGPFLRTGDLGFLDGEELFVTGRIKDLIIIRGRNHYPQDIERSVEACHRALRRDHGVAFSMDVDGSERLIVIQGVVRPQKLNVEDLFAQIRGALIHEHELAPYAIVLVKGGEIPRTSSGKIQRRACKQLYVSQELDVVAEWRSGETEATTKNGQGEKHSPNGHANGKSLNGNGSAKSRASKKGTPNNGKGRLENGSADSILVAVTRLVRELKNGSAPASIHRDSQLFADLSLESIDLVVLNENIERHYDRQFPFMDFMAELGRKDQRDVSMGQFVDFLDGCLNR